MASNLINTREDLDALAGTSAHAEAMTMLCGTLWRLEKDDIAKAWKAVPDESTVARFGLTLADFPGANPPELPVYVAPPSSAPQAVTRAQAKAALLIAGKLAQVQPAIDAITDPMQRGLVQIDWDDRLVFERGNPTLIALSSALGMDEAALDALFVAGAAL